MSTTSIAPARGEGGRPPSSEQPARANDVADPVGPQAGIERLDAYARWIFISAGVIAVLGVGLSAAAFSTLSGLGRVVFGIALAAVGLSVASSALSLALQSHPAGSSGGDPMLEDVDAEFAARRKLLVVACVSFAIALFLAGIAPLASGVRFPLSNEGPHHSLTYNLDAVAGSFQATLSGNDFGPGSAVELKLLGTPWDHDKSVVLPRSRAIVDGSGAAKLTVTMPHVDMMRELVVVTHVVEATGKVKDEILSISTGTR
jgi:hypothetical protein